MQTIDKKVVYKGFGFIIDSDFLLPELPEYESKDEQIDIVFELTDLTDLWAHLREQHDSPFIMKENFTMFQVPNVAIYLIQNGNRVFVSPLTGSNEDLVRLFLLGTCMGALLLQRRILPLHGSAVEINGKAYAIVGDSGAGKSTLASAFLRKGYRLISDDVIPVSFTSANTPVVTPAYPQQKLWQESLKAFGDVSDHLRPIVDREDKFVIPVHDQFATKPLPLAGIFELVKTEETDIGIQPLTTLHSLQTIFHHTYRHFLLAPARLMQWHFQFTADLVNSFKSYRISRPGSYFSAHDLTTLILNTVKGEE